MGMLDKALILAQAAEKLYQSEKSPYLSDCHGLLLIIYFNQHKIPEAKKYLTLCKKENVPVDVEIEKGLR
jgi:hypothetical protein